MFVERVGSLRWLAICMLMSSLGVNLYRPLINQQRVDVPVNQHLSPSYNLSLSMNPQSSLQYCQQERFYFAFGSNLHLGQMAKRCPESRYIGTAKLHDYRFQINQRGFANVLRSPGDCVEGLVYLLNLTDEARLDKSEGVPTAYQKCNVAIEVFTATIDHVGRAVPELSQRLDASEPHTVPLGAPTKSMDFHSDSLNDPHLPVYQQKPLWPSVPKNWWSLARGFGKNDTNNQAWADKQVDAQAGHDGPRRRDDYSLKGQATEALVYLSNHFVQDSEPRNEYIDRINAGIIDARKLGMSDIYIDTCLRHYIRIRESHDTGFTVVQQRIPESHSHRSKQSGSTKYRISENKHRPRYETVTTKTKAPAIDHRERRRRKSAKRYDASDTESDPHPREEQYE